MAQHIKILGVLHIVFGCLGVLIGLGVMAFMGGLGMVAGRDGDPEAGPIMALIGGVAMVVLLVISVPGIIGGFGLINRKSWARILIIVISCLELFSFPFGTALGVYGLWVLLNKETPPLFA
jgi:hypothetical protein